MNLIRSEVVRGRTRRVGICLDVHFLGLGYGELLRKMVRRTKAGFRNDKKEMIVVSLER
jgi:hypothetical protein